jgi:pilus assembly protein Flp/PilA
LAETYGHRREKEMLKLYLWIRNLLADEQGQTLTEYALILVLIAVVAIIAVTALGGGITSVLEEITTGLGAVAPE